LRDDLYFPLYLFWIGENFLLWSVLSVHVRFVIDLYLLSHNVNIQVYN